MRVLRFALPLLLSSFLFACGGGKPSELSSSPTSVRGWISDITAQPTSYATVGKPTADSVRRRDLFGRSNIYVEHAPYASGGMSPEGSFILLDVPPGGTEITFQTPGYPDSQLKLEGIPGNADVLIPAIILAPNGAIVADPKKIEVRIPGEKKRLTGKFAMVAGAKVPVMEVPLDDMGNRRDYPDVPSQPLVPIVVK